MSGYPFDLQKISDQLYDQQYKGCFNKVFFLCLKSKLRKERQDSILDEWQTLYNKKNAAALE
jgi:hypothetical protein